MIIESPFPARALGLVAEMLGSEATEEDAERCIENLQRAGWTGWSTNDMPEGIFLDAAQGPVKGPESIGE